MNRRMKIPGGCYMADLIEGKSWIDAKNEGNVLRFMNHHCTAFNCELRNFVEGDGSISLGIWTIRRILDKEDLFFNYGDQNSNNYGDQIDCLCAGIEISSGLVICPNKL
jgi:SET domain-containing protein